MLHKLSYVTVGTCSRRIDIELDDQVIRSIHFEGGCDGNLQGISRLMTGMKVSRAISCLEGIDCRGKGTSCPDQLSKALRRMIE